MKKIVVASALAGVLALSACSGHDDRVVTNSSTSQELDNGAVVTSNSTTTQKN